MDITDCPHCFTRVLPGADGSCPSCRCRVDDPTFGDPSKARCEIRALDADLLPEICLACAGSTNEVAVIVRSRDEDTDASVVAMLLELVFHPAAALARWMLRHRERVMLSVPMCGECYRKAKPQPESVNFEISSMTFIAPKTLRDALARAREAARGAGAAG